MTVGELISVLQTYDPDINVYVGIQGNRWECVGTKAPFIIPQGTLKNEVTGHEEQAVIITQSPL